MSEMWGSGITYAENIIKDLVRPDGNKIERTRTNANNFTHSYFSHVEG
jgi:hypothetical protein